MTQTRKHRVPKTSAERLADCETHLYFLWDAVRLYSEQPDRFKQIAAELRVLVCETRMNKPLLLNLMDEFSFVYEIKPPRASASGPPLLQPLPMIGWRDDLIHAEISERLSQANKSEDTAHQMQEIERRLAELAKPVQLREWINRGLAVFIAPYEYSYRELALAIAQQFGSSHEDDSVEEPILRLQQTYIGGERGDLAPLLIFAETVLSAGVAFIRHVEKHHDFRPRYFRAEQLS